MASLSLTSTLPYLDLLWLAIIFIILPRKQWAVGISFIISCLLMTRLQTQLIYEIKSYVPALPHWGVWPLLYEIMIIYGVIIMLYFILMFFSRNVPWLIHMAASIVLLLSAFTLSFVTIVL